MPASARGPCHRHQDNHQHPTPSKLPRGNQAQEGRGARPGPGAGGDQGHCIQTGLVLILTRRPCLFPVTPEQAGAPDVTMWHHQASLEGQGARGGDSGTKGELRVFYILVFSQVIFQPCAMLASLPFLPAHVAHPTDGSSGLQHPALHRAWELVLGEQGRKN